MPTVVGPYARLAADRVTGGTTPVPLNEMVCGEPAALSVMVTAAVIAPPAVGSKCPWIVQFAPTARLVPQLFANTNDEALAPATAMLEMDTLALPVFVTVTDCDSLEAPTFTEPKERLLSDSVIGAAGSKPVPLNAMLCGDPAALSVIVTAAVIAPWAVG